ncbi:MAG: phosphoribosyltransferase family protein [Eubacteriales bacterium]|nr:phosphoribosyltransferase family protein [Clostridia bacterium]MDY2845081.1 phosphoribosyltransferase family protein [Eubacteriales bacterium]
MKTYPINIAGLHRELPICPVTDSLSIGAFVIFGDPELTTAAAKALLDLAPEYDYIITAEAKGIPLAHEMARLAGNQKYFVARKKAKAYMTGVFEVKLHSITTQGEQSLFLDKAEADLIKGSRILIVDDVISTGESLRAVEELVNAAGGIIVGKLAVLAEGDAQTRTDIKYLEKLPVFHPDGTVIEGSIH